MHFSTIIIPLLAFAGKGFASPTVPKKSFSNVVTPRDNTRIVDIPEVANYPLIKKPNGDEYYDLPKEGITLSAGEYKNLTGREPPPMEKRQENPCSAGTHRVWDVPNPNWVKITRPPKVMSSPICGPASISNTFTESFSYSIGTTATAGFSVGTNLAGTGSIGVSFTYTWGEAIATGYSATCSDRHPCVATFSAWFGKVTGRARFRDLSNGSNKLCATGYQGTVDLELPMVRDCNDKQCGQEGVWDHCYYVGSTAEAMCPNNLGPKPKTQCASSLYPGGS